MKHSSRNPLSPIPGPARGKSHRNPVIRRHRGPFLFFARFFAAVFFLTSAVGIYPIKVGNIIEEQPQNGQTQSAPAQPAQPAEFAGKATQEVQQSRTPYKDPRLACLLSFMIPGSGEFYLRNDVKAIMFCLGVSAGYLLSLYYFYQGLPAPIGTGESGKLIIGSIISLVSLVVHVIGMVESYNDAVKINEARFYREY